MRPYLLLFCLLLSAPVRAALAAPVGLTVMPGPGTTQAGPTTVRYDLGTRRMTDESPIEHTFTLRNEGPAPITIDRLQSSCGCVSAFLGGEQSPPLTIGPGGIVPVRISIAPHRLAPGPLIKSVWVFTHGAADATLLLELTGTLQDDDAPAAVPTVTAGPTESVAAPRSDGLAPTFTLADTHGKPFALASIRGRPAALFFFCGCPWCAEAARAWGQAQRALHLPVPTRTVVVFAGTSAESTAFAAKNGLDLAQTTLVPDPASALTEGLYKLNSCPRVFALNAAGTIRYTNDHTDDQPRVASARTIIGRTLLALRSGR